MVVASDGIGTFCATFAGAMAQLALLHPHFKGLVQAWKFLLALCHYVMAPTPWRIIQELSGPHTSTPNIYIITI